MPRSSFWISLVFANLLTASRPAHAWFCDPLPGAPPPIASEGIASAFKDNYAVTGPPGDAGQPEGTIRFQVSVKINLIPTESRCTVFFTYSQKAVWDLWNFKGSSPIIDTDFNPGLFAAWRAPELGWLEKPGPALLGLFFGVEHESNGKAGPDSRGWNRVTGFARLGYSWSEGYQLILQPSLWLPFAYRWGAPGGYDSDGGGNPDILKYYGYGQLDLELARRRRVEPGDTREELWLRDWAFTSLLRVGSTAQHVVLELTARARIRFLLEALLGSQLPPRLAGSPFALFAQCSLWNGEVLLTYRESYNVCRLGLALE